MRYSANEVLVWRSCLALALMLVALSNAKSQGIVWDTVSTGKVRLAVSNHGSMGFNGLGGVNMDFAVLGGDCDPEADVYLYSGGLFIIEEIAPGVDYRLNTGLYQTGDLTPVSFIPDANGPPSQQFVGPDGSDAFFTGRFVNRDSTLGIERTYYAPTSGPPNDEFILVRTDLFTLDGQASNPLAVGDVIDWDIPSSVATVNTSHLDEAAIQVRGSGEPACQPFDERSGLSVLLGQNLASESRVGYCTNSKWYWGIYAEPVDSSLADSANGGMEPGAAWQTTMVNTGLYNSLDTTNLYIVETYRHEFVLQPDDTLTLYTAIVSGRESWLSTLDDVSEAACGWYYYHLESRCDKSCGCCIGVVGNVDGDPAMIIDIGDLTALIGYLFIPPFTEPYCLEVADWDGNCVVDIGDLTGLIYELFIGPFPMPPWPPPCPGISDCDW